MKKYIILALVALLAAVLFVACDNDVKVDNNTAYTEVLESEGAFVVNGKGYDTLQSAIQAAVGGKSMADPVVITMTRNVTSRPVVIPEDSEIELDLGGYKLTFIDVEENAFFVGKAYFVLVNGTVALLDETAELRLICAKNNAYVTLSDVISTTGCVDITESRLAVNCYLNDVRMNDSRLYISGNGHVVLNVLEGNENSFVASSGSYAITNNSGRDIVVQEGLYSIARSGNRSYYGSLQEALDSLDAEDLTILLRGDDASTASVGAKNGKEFTIDLNGYSISASSITADANLTIVNNPTSEVSVSFAGSIDAGDNDVKITGNSSKIVVVSGTVTAGKLTAEYATFQDDIFASVSATVSNSNVGNGDGDGVFAPAITISGSYLDVNCLQKTEGGEAAASVSVTNSYGSIGSIVASNSVTLSSMQTGDTNVNPLTVGMIDAGTGSISITGHYYIESETDYTDYVIVNGTVTCATLEATYAKFKAPITATTSVDIENSVVGEESDDIYSPSITIANSVLSAGNLKGSSNAAAASVSVTSSTGTIGAIYASEGITLSTPQVADTELEDPVWHTLIVDGVMNAYTSNISITGHTHENNDPTDALPAYTVYDYVGLNGEVKCATLSADIVFFDYDSTIEASVVKASDETEGRYYGWVSLVGSGNTAVPSGSFFEEFIYNGTGTLTVTGGDFYGITGFLSGSSIVLNGTYNGEGVAESSNYGLYFSDIYAVTDNVHIKSAYIEENSLADVEKLVHRINQNGSGQQIYINYNRYGIENLTGVDNVFDMTSANIQSAGSACLNFTMYETDYYDTDDVVTSGLIVGSEDDSTPASATFNYNNGSGKNQLVVTGKIGLFEGYENAVFSTQLHDDFIYMCTYELVDDNEGTENDVYGYVIRTEASVIGSVAGYYEYRNNGN